MSADPWPLAVLLHTVSAPNKRQEPGWVNLPALVWSPDQEEHLRTAWRGDAIRAKDVPGLHAGPITHARPAATLAVAQREQQNPQWVVCMFSRADAHIVVCDLERLPGPEAVVCVADCTRMIVKALQEGEHHALLLQVRLKDNAGAAKPGVWPAAAHPADLELQLAGPTTVYHWLQAFHDLRWRGKPDRQIGSTHWQTWLQADAQRDAVRSLGPAPATRALDVAALGRAFRHTRFHWPTCPSNQRRRAPSGSRCRSPKREGPRNQRNTPHVQTSTTQAGQCWNTWRGTQCTLQPRWTTRRRPPTSCTGGHGGPHGTPRTPGAPRPRRPTTQTATRRHPERPQGPAVRPNEGPSPRGWPPWPPCGPCWERALRTPWPRRTREPWLHQWTQRRCRCGTAASRRTRRTTPYGSSRGTFATASYRQTGPSRTRSGGARGRRPVPTRSTSSPACCNCCIVADLSCNCEACSLDAPGVVTPDTAPDISEPN